MLARVVNNYAGCLDARGVLGFLASLLAPTGDLWRFGVCVPVGASTLAMVINDDAGCLDARGGLEFFASLLAPTGG
jgi:hypothetical protein